MHNVKEITPSSSEVNNLYKIIVRFANTVVFCECI